jgi:hypothetical protein
MAATVAQERRRRYLEIALRRIRPGTGSSEAFYRRRDWTETPVDLSQIRTPFIVIGAVATRLYMPERVTRDLDLLIHRDDADSFYAELSNIGLRRTGDLSIGGSIWTNQDGFEIDVVEADQTWTREALRTARSSPDGLPVAALPFLVLLKMNASRGIDFGDLTRMLGLANEAELNKVRQVVARFQPDDSDDLEGLITLGKIEFGDQIG